MKLTKQRIKEIIKEELEGMNEEPAEVPMKESLMDLAVQAGMDPTFLQALETLGAAVKKFSTDPFTAPLVFSVLGGTPVYLAVEKYLEKKRKKGAQPASGMETASDTFDDGGDM